MGGERLDNAEYERRRQEYRRVAVHGLKKQRAQFVRSFAGKVVIWAGFAAVVITALISFDVLQPGTAADWVAAAGTTFAAVVALSIATRDRRERADERHQEELAQMRLVRLLVRSYRDSSMPAYNFAVSVTNHGRQPILQAHIRSADVFTGNIVFGPDGRRVPNYKLSDPGPVPHVMDVIPHLEQQRTLTGRTDSRFLISVADAENRLWDPPAGQQPHIDVKLACIDASGSHWTVSSQHGPDLHRPRLGPPAWQRLWTNRERVVRELWLIFGPSRAMIRRLRLACVILTVALLISLVARNWLHVTNTLFP